MNPSQAIANSVGKTLLAQVFNNAQLVNLFEISDATVDGSGTNASTKLQGDTRPVFDSALQTASGAGLYSKDRNTNIFPRSNAEQIARTIDVIEGRLDNKYEFNTNITFNTTTIDNVDYTLIRQVFYTQLLEVPFIAYLIDIDFNNDTSLHLSTYDKTLNIPNGYYGESTYNESNTTTYTSTSDVVKMDSTKQQADTQVGDGIPGAGITFTAETPGLLNLIQTEKHIGATITLRLIFIREGKILAGPVRGGQLKIDGANHIVNPRTGTNLITLSTIKTWENINQPHGVRTAAAYLESIFKNDGFFRNSKNAAVNKIFKEE